MEGYACIVQEDQLPLRHQEELAQGLQQIGRDLLGDPAAGAEIHWVIVPQGFGFTAGGPSSSSLVARSVPEDTPDPDRERFMRRVCELWTGATGCSADELVVTTLNGPIPL